MNALTRKFSLMEWGVFCLLLLLILCVRLGFGSWQQWQRANQWQQQGELRQAAWHWGRAIRWYFPGNPYVGKSVQALQLQVDDYMQQSRWQEAYESAQIMHAALNAVRSFYQPYRERLHALDLKLAQITKMVHPEATQDVQAIYTQLSTRHDPHRGWSLLAIISFFGWIGLAVLLIRTAFNSHGKWLGGRLAYQRVGLLFLAILTWLLSIWQA